MILHTITDVKYLPLPNQVEFIADSSPAPLELTSTAFLMPFVLGKRVVFANNSRRGLEVPGGHVEVGETLEQAAKRECLEETGCHVTMVVPIGYLRMTSEGEVPEDWKYPHPVSYQQFYAGFVDWIDPYEVNDECLQPFFFSRELAEAELDPQRLAIYLHACEVMKEQR
jgi:8-oxo-dGTP pyrophosphatase MutT (NUDIX family)